MHYRAIKTLFPAFFIWQTLSMSQFTLQRKTYAPKHHKSHNILAGTSFCIQLIVFFYGFYNPEMYLDITLPLVLICSTAASLTLNRFCSILTVIESRLHQKDEMKFLALIAKSDKILINILHIDIKYKEQKQNNIQQLVIRILLLLILNASFMIDWLFLETAIQITIWYALLVFPIFISSMRYHQIISYVNLIRDRYKLLNEYIERIRLKESVSFGVSIEMAYKQLVHSCQKKNFESIMIMNQLKHIQEIQSYLLDGRCIINNSFKWSLLMNLVNDFQSTLGSGYFLIFSTIKEGINIDILSGTVWVVYGLFNFASLANACLLANEEVGAL